MDNEKQLSMIHELLMAQLESRILKIALAKTLSHCEPKEANEITELLRMANININ